MQHLPCPRLDCSHEMKGCLLLGRKAMTNIDSTLKSRDITLPTKVHLVKAMVFPIVTYGCESRTIKKTEHWRNDALNCGVGEDSWESLGLQGDPTSPFWRRSVLNVHWNDWYWNWYPILWPPHAESTHSKSPWCWERLKAGGEGDDRGFDGWMASPTQWMWVWASSGRWWRTGKLPCLCCSPWGRRVRHNWVTEWQQDKSK